MALSRFTTYAAYALDLNNGQITSGINASAVSIPLTNINGTIGTTGTLIIVDGPNTEAVTVTNFSAGAATVSPTAYAHNEWVYCVFQATAGPTAFLPLETFKPSDEYDQLYDMAVVGSLVDNRGAVQGVRTSSWDIAGAFFADTIGYMLGAVFGAETYTGGSPNTHAFTTYNPGDSGTGISPYGSGQPPRCILYNYDGYNTRLFCGRITEVALTADPKQLLKFTAKFLGRASGVVANPTKSFSAIVPLPAWTGTATIGGVQVGKILTADFTWARGEVEAIPTLSGIQDPWDIFVGALSTKGKFSLVFDDDVQQLAYFNATQPTVVLTFTRGTGAAKQALAVQMTACNYEKADVIQQGKSYITNDIQFAGIGNATDANSLSGISTSLVTLSNAVASGATYVS